MCLWEGTYENHTNTWLRWCDQEGVPVLSGAEGKEQERQRAEEALRREEQERQRAQHLAEKLRNLGINPDA